MNNNPMHILGHCYKTYNHQGNSFNIAITSLEKGIVDNLMNYLQRKYKKVSINITPHIYTNRLYGHIKVER